MKRARLILNHTPDPPFRTPGSESVASVDTIVKEILGDLGYEVSCAWRERNLAPEVSDWVPIDVARSVLALQTEPTPDLELRTNTSSHLFPLRARAGQKNVVFLHALLSYSDPWLGSDLVDSYWANSEYLARVLRSLLATPDWQRGRLLDPRAFSIVGPVTLALPYLEQPEGIPQGRSAELPPAVLAALDAGDVLGHCVASKIDERATYSILLALNQMSIESGARRRFRLFIANATYEGLKRWLQAAPGALPAELAPLKDALGKLGLTIDDILIPIPRLAQAALFRLLRGCRFGLFYHWVPEPFGLLPLESICLGCPVYTNGAGNLRYLMPADHGMNVFETEEMPFGDLAGYAEVARRIFHDAAVDPAPAREACRRGASHIAATYTRQAMRRDVEARLAELARPPAEHDLASARIGLSPLVRRFNPETRRLVSDLTSMKLPAALAALLTEVLGQRCGELACRGDAAAMKAVDGFFQQGILALQPAAAPGAEPASASAGSR